MLLLLLLFRSSTCCGIFKMHPQCGILPAGRSSNMLDFLLPHLSLTSMRLVFGVLSTC